MRARRDTLKLSMRAAALRGGTSPSTWSDVEGGHRTNLEASTQRAIAQGLGWEFDWLDRILAGDEPIELSQRRPDDGDVRGQVARLAEAHQETAETLAVLLGEFAALKRRVDGIEDQRVAR